MPCILSLHYIIINRTVLYLLYFSFLLHLIFVILHFEQSRSWFINYLDEVKIAFNITQVCQQLRVRYSYIHNIKVFKNIKITFHSYFPLKFDHKATTTYSCIRY